MNLLIILPILSGISAIALLLILISAFRVDPSDETDSWLSFGKAIEGRK